MCYSNNNIPFTTLHSIGIYDNIYTLAFPYASYICIYAFLNFGVYIYCN